MTDTLSAVTTNIMDVTTVTVEPPKKDWELAKVRWLQGVKSPQIGAEIGVSAAAVRQHAIRHKWNELKAKAISISTTTVSSKTTSLRTKLIDTTNKAVDSLSKVNWTPKATKEYASTLHDLAKTGSLAEGWADQQSSKIDIHVLANGEDDLVVPSLALKAEEKACLVEPVPPEADGVTPFLPPPVE